MEIDENNFEDMKHEGNIVINDLIKTEGYDLNEKIALQVI